MCFLRLMTTLFFISIISSDITVKLQKVPGTNCRISQYLEWRYHAICTKGGYQSLNRLPINTTSLWVIRNTIAILNGAPFKSLPNITRLHLKGNNLSTLEKDAFEGLHKLEELDLSNNKLRQVDKNVLKHCPLLKSINFAANWVIRLNTFSVAMSSLHRLEKVSFNDNMLLEVIEQDDLKPLNQSIICQLDFTACQLRNISSGAFSHLKHLKVLSLSINRGLSDDQIANALYNITSKFETLDLSQMKMMKLPSKTLQALSSTNIRELDLKYNTFMEIQESFPPIPSLIHLNLKKCDMYYMLHTMVFANLTSLEKLDISHNRLQGIQYAIYNITTLKWLDTSGNTDPAAPNVAFSFVNRKFKNLQVLEKLYLNFLKIGMLGRYDLYGLINLKELYLIGSLMEIEENCFETLSRLEKLDLSRNAIPSMPENLFKGLINLKYLILQNVNLKSMPDPTQYHHMPSLDILDLRDNGITQLTSDGIPNSLELLLLRENAILSWDEPILSNKNKRLESIDLKYNNLQFLTPVMVEDFNLLVYVDISNNPYNCSKCEIAELAKWVNSTNTTVQGVVTMTCSNPTKLRDVHIFNVPLPNHCIVNTLQRTIAVTVSVTIILTITVVSVIIGYRFRWYFRYYWFLTRARVQRMKLIAASDGFKYDAFISYNALDQQWVVANLLPKLESEEPKFKVCLHERDFEIGKEIILNVVESIDNSRKIVLLLSNNFISSQWCTWEMNMAQFKLVDDCRDALVLIMLEKIEKEKMSSTLKYLIKTRTYLEWVDNAQGQKLFWERLKFALQRPAKQNEQQVLL